MVARTLQIALVAALAVGTLSCKKQPVDDTAAREAKFRSDQKARALKAYHELVKKYPDSDYAPKAQERIRALGPAATPAAK